MKLAQLGYADWFQDRSEETAQPEWAPARVVTVHKDRYTIRNQTEEVTAEITGKLMYGAASRLDLPTVGDWVLVQYLDGGTLAIIHAILPRKTLLKRKVAGRAIDYQLIAANIDAGFIMQSADANFNLRRLERYLVMVNDSQISPVVVISKVDLVSARKLEHIMAAVLTVAGKYPVLAVSMKNGQGLDDILNAIEPCKTYCLLGSSGVGKTTLLNSLLGQEALATRTVRAADSKGRHTTARRQLILLENGGMFIDTPGMRELGNFGVAEGLEKTFDEIQAVASSCRFSDCSHTSEAGCAVIAGVKRGSIPAGHYENFLRLQRESAHYEMSYLERRKKDKQFGKMVKDVMKHKKTGKG